MSAPDAAAKVAAGLVHTYVHEERRVDEDALSSAIAAAIDAFAAEAVKAERERCIACIDSVYERHDGDSRAVFAVNAEAEIRKGDE